MKIHRVGLKDVLHFSQVHLDFGQHPAGLHVIYGPNEAGKSTLLQAVVDLLFGGHIEDEALALYTTQSRIYGALGAEGAGPNEWVDISRRRKWRSLFLADGQDGDLPEETLSAYLGGLDKERYRLLFGFNHEGLRSGGESLLASGGDAGISLFEAGGGLQFLQSALQTLEKRMDDLIDPAFRRQNSAKRINAAWNRYREKMAAAKKAGLRGEEWDRQKMELEQWAGQVDALRASQRDLQMEKARLQRIRRVRQTVGALEGLKQTAASQERPRVLADDTEVLIETTVQALRNVREQSTVLGKQVEERQEQVEAIAVDEQVLARTDDIAALMEQVQQVVAYREDVTKLRIEHQQTRGQAEQILRDLHPGLMFERLEQLRIPFSVQQEIRRLSEDWKELARRAGDQTQKEQELEGAARQLEQQRAEMGTVPDVAALRSVGEAVQELGDPEGEAERLRAEIADREAEAERLLRGQSIWTGHLHGLAQLKLPLAETVELAIERFGAVEAHRAELERTLNETQQTQADVVAGLEDLEVSGTVLVDEDLEGARVHRQTGWSLIRKQLLGESADADAIQAFARDRTLAEAYEVAVVEADRVADWMRRESDRSVRKAQWLLQKDRLERKVESLTRALDTSSEEVESLQRAWEAEWAESTMVPRSPIEMKAWMRDVARPLQEAAYQLERMHAQLRQLDDVRDTWFTRLMQVLPVGHQEIAAAREMAEGNMERTGPEATSGTALLRQLMRKVQALIAEADKKAVTLEYLQKQQADLEGKWNKLKADQAEWSVQGNDLKHRWEVLREAHPHLPTEIVHAPAYLEQLQKLFDALKEADRLAEDIRMKEDVCTRFETDVRALAEVLQEDDFGTRAPDVLARSLNQRAVNAQQAASKRDNQRVELEKVQHELRGCRERIETLDRTIKGLLEEHGLSSDSQLVALVQQSQDAKTLAEQTRQTERRLQEMGDGLTVDELVEEVRQAPDVDTLSARLLELETDIDSLGDELHAANQELGMAKQRFAALDGESSDAALYSLEAQAELAEVDKLWNEYVRLDLARRLLVKSIEAFRAANESVVVQRAGALFHALTLERYQTLQVEYDGADPYLQAVAKEGVARRVAELSDGTRDQLYLALRLAFVEQLVQSGSNLPLIMDDILVHYDDERSTAALRTLAGLGHETQVLYFTHHKRIVESAAAIAQEGSVPVHIHELSRP